MRVTTTRLVLLFVMATLLPAIGFSDEASNIARMLELEDAQDELRELRRSGEITRNEMQVRKKAIQEERKAINSSYGKRGTAGRKDWDKKVRTAKKERLNASREARREEQAAKKQAEAEARAEKRKAEAEQAAAAKLAAYEKSVAEASIYSQVHLPEEVFVPMQTTEIQGIEFGMPREKAWRALIENGYSTEAGLRIAGGGKGGRIEDEQSTRTLILWYHDYKIPEMSGLRVRFIRYEQHFKPEIKFDPQAIAEQLKNKYGPPVRETTGPKGVSLVYGIERPDYNLEVACQEEMAAKGTVPEKPYPPLAGPTSGKAWLERGERDVKERCPDQLQIFRHVMHAGMGVSAPMSVVAQTKELAIEIQDNGWEMRPRRRQHEEKFLEKDSGGAAEVKL
jgi:Skp family chaperone for outer membrane proteins